MLIGALLVVVVQATPLMQRDTAGQSDTAAIVPASSTLKPSTHTARRPVQAAPPDTGRRPVAIEYSDEYYQRLLIHRWASYVELPLFGAEYYLGQRLLSQNLQPAWVKTSHAGVAVGLDALFVVNTLTGAWNLWDSRHDPSQKPLVITHSVLMLASDAGFVVTGLLAQNARESTANANRHRNAAIVSMSTATVGTVMMWLWRQ